MSNTHIERQRHRERMSRDIIQQVRNAVQDELAGASASFEFEDLEQIEESVMSHTQQVVDALSYDEMQSKRGLSLHVENACIDTTRRINELRLAHHGETV
jgi:hypothetical protein